jgi:hypothetical protein
VRVAVEGVFDHGASQYVGPRTRQVAGTSKQVGPLPRPALLLLLLLCCC